MRNGVRRLAATASLRLTLRKTMLALLGAVLLAASPHQRTAAGCPAPPLLLTGKFEGQDPKNMYVGFVGGVGTTLSATNVATGAPLAVSQYGSPNWYTLDTLPEGISLTCFVGGRIYVGYGTPWTFQSAGYEPPSG